MIFQDMQFNNVVEKISKEHMSSVSLENLQKWQQVIKQTHVKGSKVDMSFLAELAQKCNANESVIQEIKKANTARHVSEIIQKK